jgi:Ser/Thr protein kinase RdoA (MazF antagonist)
LALKQALGTITTTIKSVWEQTRRDEAVKPHFLKQLEARLEDVYAVHPDLLERNGAIGRMQVQSFTSLLDSVRGLDQDLASPFSVFIHGDFNVDNIIYDNTNEAVRLIDLHRSRFMDYVQDVSVFLVSNFRLQIFDIPLRQRTNDIILNFYSFAEAFAEENKDKTFPLRLALGVARSFATSTRFVLDNHLAHAMFSRSRYLLEQVVDSARAGRLEHFVFPRGVLLD